MAGDASRCRNLEEVSGDVLMKTVDPLKFAKPLTGGGPRKRKVNWTISNRANAPVFYLPDG